MQKRMLAAGALALSFGAGGAALAQDAAQIEEGEGVFRRCAACHQVGEGAENKVGPQLASVIGRTAGTLEGFEYSDAMVEFGAAGTVWDEATLVDYLEAPRTTVKGTNMAFAGLKDEADRQAVVAYIVSQQVTN